MTFGMARDPSSGEFLRSVTETDCKATTGLTKINRKCRGRNPTRRAPIIYEDTHPDLRYWLALQSDERSDERKEINSS